MEIIIAFLALAIGFAAGFLFGRLKESSIKNEVNSLNQRLDFQKASSESALKEKDQYYSNLLKEKEWAYQEAMTSQKQYMAETLDAVQGRFDETVAKMKAEISSLTAGMLKERQSEFESSSRESVSRILQPLEENIASMRKAVDDNTRHNSEISGRLDSSLRMVLQHSDAARKSADRLADALRGGGRIQGDWGETILTALLQSQGLEEGVHFDTQVVMKDSAGAAVKSSDDKLLRPDVVLHLDRQRDVIIDAKVSLSAFLDYMNADDDKERAQALKNHVLSLENHVNELVRKNYSNYVMPPKVSVGYVIMFVPYTAALHAAISAKPDLWRKAMEKNVYIADEQTLYAALKIIHLTWRQISQAENHEKVYALANEMLDRVSAFIERFTKVGKQLDDARRSYDDAFAKLRDSGKSIPQTCRKLINLGASVKPRKGVDPSFFDTDFNGQDSDADLIRQGTRQELT